MLDTASQTGLSPGRRTAQRLLLGGGSAILIAFVVTSLSKERSARLQPRGGMRLAN